MTGKFLNQIKQEKKMNKLKRKNWTESETQGKQMALPIHQIAGKTEQDQGVKK